MGGSKGSPRATDTIGLISRVQCVSGSTPVTLEDPFLPPHNSLNAFILSFLGSDMTVWKHRGVYWVGYWFLVQMKLLQTSKSTVLSWFCLSNLTKHTHHQMRRSFLPKVVTGNFAKRCVSPLTQSSWTFLTVKKVSTTWTNAAVHSLAVNCDGWWNAITAQGASLRVSLSVSKLAVPASRISVHINCVCLSALHLQSHQCI